ncbi:MAG: MotA/TolQ/ExbB proton channel family protein, partial [Planctomycetota bacterium]
MAKHPAALTIGIAGAALWAALAAAQEGGADLPMHNTWTLIRAGGLTGFVILILSCVALVLILEQIITLRERRMVPSSLVADLEKLFGSGALKTAEERCRQEDTFLSRVLLPGLVERSAGLETMEGRIEEAGRLESMRLLHRVGYLSVIANVAPMLGLLGTVIGMIEAFGEISRAGTPSPQNLAGPIAKALVTTCEGLIVAIPCVAAFYIFDHRVRRAARRCEVLVVDLLALLRTRLA